MGSWVVTTYNQKCLDQHPNQRNTPYGRSVPDSQQSGPCDFPCLEFLRLGHRLNQADRLNSGSLAAKIRSHILEQYGYTSAAPESALEKLCNGHDCPMPHQLYRSSSADDSASRMCPGVQTRTRRSSFRSSGRLRQRVAVPMVGAPRSISLHRVELHDQCHQTACFLLNSTLRPSFSGACSMIMAKPR